MKTLLDVLASVAGLKNKKELATDDELLFGYALERFGVSLTTREINLVAGAILELDIPTESEVAAHNRAVVGKVLDPIVARMQKFDYMSIARVSGLPAVNCRLWQNKLSNTVTVEQLDKLVAALDSMEGVEHA